MADEPKVKRVPVKYRYDAIHPDFLKMLAEIGAYAEEKYGAWHQYFSEGVRLTGDADPINHIYEHLREYRMLEPYDHFEGARKRHLAAIAYNAMMAFVADSRWGDRPEPHVADGWSPPGGAPLAMRFTVGRGIEATIDVASTEAKTDWGQGLAHFQTRWQSGLDGARDPGSIRRFQGMVDAVTALSRGIQLLVAASPGSLSDAVVLDSIDSFAAAAKEKLMADSTPENIETQQAWLAALDTLKVKIPDMFPRKAGT